jgi:hypothetical protein
VAEIVGEDQGVKDDEGEGSGGLRISQSRGDFTYPGYAWAARRALIGRGAETYQGGLTADYKDMVAQGERRALDMAHKNVGFVPGSQIEELAKESIKRHRATLEALTR